MSLVGSFFARKSIVSRSGVWCKGTLKDLFKNRVTHSGLRDNNKLVQSKFNTIKYGFRSFQYYGAKVWNALPINVKEASSLHSFKTNMKEWCKSDACKNLEI